MDNRQEALAEDHGGLMRHEIMRRWDERFPNGRYRLGTVPQHSRRFIAATAGQNDAAHIGKITIPAQEIRFFDYKVGDSLSDAAANYTADAVDTSLNKVGQLDADEEMVIEKLEFHGGVTKVVWASMPYSITAGHVTYDPYGTLIAVEVGSGRALQDVLLNAFLAQSRLFYQYQGGKAGTENLGPGVMAVGGSPYAVGDRRPAFPIPEGLFWGSEQDPTGHGTASDSRLTIVAKTEQPIYVVASFLAAARVPTNIQIGCTCVARGLNFRPTGKTN